MGSKKKNPQGLHKLSFRSLTGPSQGLPVNAAGSQVSPVRGAAHPITFSSHLVTSPDAADIHLAWRSYTTAAREPRCQVFSNPPSPAG